MPQEEARFNRTDDEYKSIMRAIADNNKVVNIYNVAGLSSNLDMILDQLDRCQKALNDFLEAKRSKFARFYFIGDDDLLEILGQSKNPDVIQSHLKKLFEGISKVLFDENQKNIIAMRSSAGEVVHMDKLVPLMEEVERWMETLTKHMVSTLQKLLEEQLSTDLDISR